MSRGPAALSVAALMVLALLSAGPRAGPAWREHGEAPREAGRAGMQLHAAPAPATGVLSSRAGPGLDWREAIRTAVARHPSVAAARAALDAQSSLVRAARAGYRPRLQAELSSGEPDQFGTGQVATLGLSQTLYDFGKTGSAVERERAGERGERALALRAVDQVVEDTTRALIEIHRNQALRESVQAQLEALDRIREITELRADAGAATRSDPLQARSRMEATQARLLGIESQLRQWRSRLSIYIGPDALQAVAPAPAALLDAATEGFDLDSVPALQVARADREAAQAELRNVRAQRYPTIVLEANANMRLGGTSDRYEQVYGDEQYSTAFISLRSPLYQGGELSARSRASAAALQAAEARLQAERLSARDEQQRHVEQIQGLLARMDVLEARVNSITETRSLYWDQYLSLGTRNALDLLNAEQEIGLSREDLVNARHDLWDARLGLLLATGRARAAFGVHDDAFRGDGHAP
ncbi:TolC family protein [Marilutibacter aestuarii]|uniref:Transporter n=1 Tax=Marilutibacter aestuarii TaxID=1706195 RepID=A0A508AB96_9GAMM|nr:TolC family protein [Lysobacter aestuarii]TQD46667.1 transporter [Lysobacter aestuarii]